MKHHLTLYVCFEESKFWSLELSGNLILGHLSTNKFIAFEESSVNLQQTRISIQKIEDATRFVAYNTYLVYRKFMNCRNTKAKSFKENPTEHFIVISMHYQFHKYHIIMFIIKSETATIETQGGTNASFLLLLERPI